MESTLNADAEATEGSTGVFRLRDFPMTPRRGVHMGVHWMQFEASLQIRIPLRGAEWDSLQPEMFHIMASKTEIIARCRACYIMEEVNLRLQHEVNPEQGWYCLEGEIRQSGSRCKVLFIEIAKQTPGKPWGRHVLAARLQSSPVVCLQSLFGGDVPGWVSLPLRSWRDEEDKNITSREQLCSELLTAQSDTLVHVRVVLRPGPWREATRQVPHYQLWGLDVSRRHMRLFIRGDHTRPVLSGRLEGNCTPDRCRFKLTSDPDRRTGGEGDLPCLDVFLLKADDSNFTWSAQPIDYTADVSVLDQDFSCCKGGPTAVDLTGGLSGMQSEELAARAASAFNAGEFPDAIELCTRLLQCTSDSAKLLRNRSAAYLKVGKFRLALADALKAQEICPDVAKVYLRKGQALQALHRFKEAKLAFEEGAKLDPQNREWDQEISKIIQMQKEIEEKKGQWI